MKQYKRHSYQVITVLLCCFLQLAGFAAYGQDAPRAAAKRHHLADSLAIGQSLPVLPADSLTDIQTDMQTEVDPLLADSIHNENKKKLLELTANPDLKTKPMPQDSLSKAITSKVWVPNPVKATWLALVIPGGGQIYNKKYWKLPIFYGGFAGCAYALTWNNKMYKDYMQAYKDMVNIGSSASSVQDLLPPGYSISDSQLTTLLQKRKDTYRRYRDLSIFAFVGVYLLSVIDAYVDAELSNFDITPDLSVQIAPAVIGSKDIGNNRKQSVGLQCGFRF